MLQVKSVGSLLKCKHGCMCTSLQICRWWLTRQVDHNLQLSLSTSPSYQPSPLLQWSKPTAYIIYHASVQGFRQSCSTDMVNHHVRADRWGWPGASDAKENSEQTFPTAMASSQTAGSESVGALGTCEKKANLRLLSSFFFPSTSKIAVFACNHDQSFYIWSNTTCPEVLHVKSVEGFKNTAVITKSPR